MTNNQDTSGLRIAFCITCMNRLSHLQQTLTVNLADNQDYDNLIFVLLDYGDQQGVSDWVQESLTSTLQAGRLVYYRDPEQKYFRMAHSKNMAHRCAVREGADILVNVDADNFTGKGFASLLNQTFSRNPNVFLRADKAARDMCVGAGGRIALRAQDFMAVGGYDEFYVNWGNDDWNLVGRLERRGLQQIEISARFAGGIPHSNEERLENYEHPFTTDHFRDGTWRKLVQREPEEENRRTVNVSAAACFAGCGTVFKNFGSQPIQITAYDADAFC